MKKILMLGTAMSVLFLAGCGDGWNMQPYDKTPYGDRTAGHGVEYVRAHMMQEKGPVIKQAEPAKPVVKEIPAAKTSPSDGDKIINSGEKFFREKQRK